MLSRVLSAFAVSTLLFAGSAQAAPAAPAAPAVLGVTDATLGVDLGSTPATLFLGHDVTLDIDGTPGEQVVLLLSPTPPPANPPMIGGVPLAVDPASVLVIVLPVVLPPSPLPVDPPQSSISLPATIPATLPAGLTLYMQVALLAPTTLQPRLTNGMAPVTATEPTTTVDQGTQSAHPLAQPGGATVITDALAWDAFWTQHTAFLFPPPPAPGIDFSQHAVVAYFSGQKSSSGFDATIDSVTYSAAGLDLNVLATAPGFGCPVLTVITYPYHFVTIPAAVATAVTHIDVSVTFSSCP